MKEIILLVISMQSAFGQSDTMIKISQQDTILLFGGFVIAIIAIFLFLARDIILRRKTTYDKENLESKKDKTFEKYHSGWGDDYEEIGSRTNTKEDKEFLNAVTNDELPDYYDLLQVDADATQDEIKEKFRELAKKTHPDKTKEDSEEKMALLNKAYEILSDEQKRKKYDRFFKSD